MKQKLLMIAELIPYPSNSGGKLRTINMLKQLAYKYDIDYISYAQTPMTTEQFDYMKRYCNNVYVYPGGKPSLLKHFWFLLLGRSGIACAIHSREMQKQVNLLYKDNRYAWIWVERLYCMQYVQKLFRCGKPNVVLNMHDVDHESIQAFYRATTNWVRQMYYKIEYRRVLKLEEHSFAQACRLIACSERDQAVYTTRFPFSTDRWLVANNGVDLDQIGVQATAQRDAATVLFIGSLDYLCNQEGIVWFLNEIWDKTLALRPDARCVIAGSGAVPDALKQALARSTNVDFLGYVDDAYSLFRQATCLAVPLKSGSGTRLKILEALSLSLPVVSTTIGAEGLLAVDGKEIIIADEPEQYAISLARILGDEALRVKLAMNGKRLVEEHYNWREIMIPLISELEKSQ